MFEASQWGVIQLREGKKLKKNVNDFEYIFSFVFVAPSCGSSLTESRTIGTRKHSSNNIVLILST